jgi:hypothetical protein
MPCLQYKNKWDEIGVFGSMHPWSAPPPLPAMTPPSFGGISHDFTVGRGGGEGAAHGRGVNTTTPQLPGMAATSPPFL